MNANGLSGPLPPELGYLTDLTELHLGGNRFSGPIPAAWDDLTALTVLDLGGNQLTGPIPVALRDLVHLTDLDVGRDRITRSDPVEFGDTSTAEHTAETTGPTPSVTNDSGPQLSALVEFGDTSTAEHTAEITGPTPSVTNDSGPQLSALALALVAIGGMAIGAITGGIVVAGVQRKWGWTRFLWGADSLPTTMARGVATAVRWLHRSLDSTARALATAAHIAAPWVFDGSPRSIAHDVTAVVRKVVRTGRRNG